jgi:hypothetical protein
MKFSVRFWMMLALLASALVACSRTSEAPSSATPAADQPATPAPSSAAPTKEADSAQSSAVPKGGPKSSSSSSAAVPDAKSNVPQVVPPEIVNVPTGTTLNVVMIDAVGTDTNQPGDTFTASLGEPVVVNGKTVLAKGTKVKGRIETLEEPGRVKGRASLSLVLTEVMGKGKTYAISTEPYSAEAESGVKGDAVKVGGGAAIGALVGAIAGGKKGAAIGAGVGGGAGTAAVLATKGKQLKIDSETKLNFVLKRAVEVTITKSST